MRIAWLIYGKLAQLTGGYLYDARIIDGMRAAGDEVVVVGAPDLGLAGSLHGAAIAVLHRQFTLRPRPRSRLRAT